MSAISRRLTWSGRDVPAKALGLTTVWIDRRAGRGGGATASPQEAVEPDFRFKSMAELVVQHRAERGLSLLRRRVDASGMRR